MSSEIPEITILVAAPGILDSSRLESREQPDKSDFTFLVTNVDTTFNTKLTNVRLYIFFELEPLHMTINGKSNSTVEDPLIVDVPNLLPFVPSAITLKIVANNGNVRTPVGLWPFTVSAKFDAETMLPDPSEDFPIPSGVQFIPVSPD